MWPTDVLLPANAKYYGFINLDKPFNIHWDIVWTISFAITGIEHGFTTFLTTNKELTAGIPGHRLGYLGDVKYVRGIDSTIILSESGDRIKKDPIILSAYDTRGILAIALDSTGYFALSSDTYDGIGIDQTKKNSLIIRDSNDNLIFNQTLTSLDTSFFLTSSIKNYQTLRFRLTNIGKRLYIDKQQPDLTYKNLVTVNISSFNADSHNIIYSGITFQSPISSTSIVPSTLYLKNYQIQGSYTNPTYEVMPFNDINVDTSTIYTQISNIL